MILPGDRAFDQSFHGGTFHPGTVKPEEDYLELERLGKVLGIPVPMMFIKVEAINPDGSPGEIYEDRSRTFNRNFWNMLFSRCSDPVTSSGTFGAGVLSIKDTGGTTRTIAGALSGVGTASNLCDFNSMGALGDATLGIVVGTGTTAESFEHNALVTRVAHGSSAGTLSYTASANPTPSYNAGTKVWTAAQSRIFNNNSGGTIVIAETGIYANFGYANTTSGTFMIERSLLGATVSVLNAGQLTVTYTTTLTFPA